MVDVCRTVVETASFLSAAKRCMTEDERAAAVVRIAGDPTCGDRLEGGNGIRKVRFAVGGRGKRGGVRIVYYYHDDRRPIFLLTVFAKNERADLSPAERASLGKLARQLAETYGESI